MNEMRLTGAPVLATSPAMTGGNSTRAAASAGVGFALACMAGGLLVGALSGCVSVNAPDKPIVIELNINVKQEVVYRLAADANKTIDENKQIF